MCYGLKAVFFSTVGNILGLFILSSVAMFGVGALLKSSAIFYIALKIIGAIYLIYLGLKQIYQKQVRFSLKDEPHCQRYSTKEIFIKGFLVAVTNPKPILFFGAIFPLFMDEKKDLVLQFFIMTATFTAISFCSLMFYGYISKSAKSWFFDENKLKIFYRVSGVLFVLMGLGMIFL
jgi:threonine/homoserine/homoserine lactone efflux protein